MSLKVQLKFKGIEGAQALSKIYIRKRGGMTKKMVETLSFATEGGAKVAITKLRAVDTGRLRSSIFASFRKGFAGSLVGVVKPNTEYDYAVHEGLGTNSVYGRRPFMEIGAMTAVGGKESEVAQIALNTMTEVVNEAKRIK